MVFVVMKMKYILGSLIISFGILVVGVVILISLNIKAPENVLEYLGWGYLLLSIASYPLARRLIRD